MNALGDGPAPTTADTDCRGIAPRDPELPQTVVLIDDLVHRHSDGSFVRFAGAPIRISAGERVAVVGPNGGGKSTLLRHVLGLEVPHTGTVQTLGHVAHMLSSVERGRMCVVVQEPDLQIFGPTVWDDVAFLPQNLGLGDDLVHRLVDQALARFELLSYARRIVHTLSVGERRRVAFAGAFVLVDDCQPPPRLVVLDEPHVALDRVGADALDHILDLVHRRYGAAVLLATHDAGQVVTHADRVIVIGALGQVVVDGRVEDVLGSTAIFREADMRLPAVLEIASLLRRRGVEVPETSDMGALVEAIVTMFGGSRTAVDQPCVSREAGRASPHRRPSR